MEEKVKKFLDFFEQGGESFFTMQTIASFGLMSIIIGVIWDIVPWKEGTYQQLIWCSIITFVIMNVYAFLSLKYPLQKPKLKIIGVQIFLSLMNSIYIIAVVSGYVTAKEFLFS